MTDDDTIPFDADDEVCLDPPPPPIPTPQVGVEFYGTQAAQDKLITALICAKQDFDLVAKSSAGQFGRQEFNYADFNAIAKATEPHLMKNGVFVMTPISGAGYGTQLSVSCIVAGHGARIVSRASFEPGQWVQLTDRKNVQEVGRITTYLRRYLLQGMLNIMGDDDADAPHRGQVQSVASPQPAAPSQKQAPPPRQNPAIPVEKRAAFGEKCRELGVTGPQMPGLVKALTGLASPKEMTEATLDTLLGRLEMCTDPNGLASLLAAEQAGKSAENGASA